MFTQVVPVNLERHGQKKVRLSSDFYFASNFHLAYVTVHEFVRSAATYPVIFLEDKERDEFRPVALLGLDAGENLFVDEKGKWDANYIPAIIRRYPFALTKASDEDRYIVCIDEASDLLSDTEGAALFDEDGKPTQVIENVKRYLTELQQMDQVTQEFTRFLTQNNLLTPLSMRVNASDQMRNITGGYVINEERLNNFSDQKFLEIREKHYLPAIYAHLVSLPQIERLVQLKQHNEQAEIKKAKSGSSEVLVEEVTIMTESVTRKTETLQ